MHCTLPVTGQQPFFQDVFVCQTCAAALADHDNDNNNNAVHNHQYLGCCRACAITCHAGHDVTYLGMGQSYCDCATLVEASKAACQLADSSRQMARSLGIPQALGGRTDVPAHLDQLQDIYILPLLRDDHHLCQLLQLESCELVRYSKDTFWLDDHFMADHHDEAIALERLAWQLYQRHIQHYALESTALGAEWWVQVKSVTVPPDLDDDTTTRFAKRPHDGDHDNDDEAVDLHYDKDEELAEHFDLGVFPVLSTVTYLTCSYPAAPTIVFDHMYTQSDDIMMHTMLVSRPELGKHVVFDGRLLHGAPAGYALRPLLPTRIPYGNDDGGQRITLLLNIWTAHVPVNVRPLPTRVRDQLRRTIYHNNDRSTTTVESILTPPNFDNIAFEPIPCQACTLADENDLPDRLHGRVMLPFVNRHAATGQPQTDHDDGNEDNIGVVTFPPPLECGTLHVTFGPGLQAYLDHDDDDDDDDDLPSPDEPDAPLPESATAESNPANGFV